MHEIFENLNALLDGDLEAITEISNDFTIQMHEDLPTVIGLIHKEHYTDARKLAHKLKGSVMNFKLPVMVEAFISLEASLDAANQDAALKYCNQILLELSNFDSYLKTLK